MGLEFVYNLRICSIIIMAKIVVPKKNKRFGWICQNDLEYLEITQLLHSNSSHILSLFSVQFDKTSGEFHVFWFPSFQDAP